MKEKRVNLREELRKLGVEKDNIITETRNISVERYSKDHYYYLKRRLKCYIDTLEGIDESIAYIKAQKARYNEFLNFDFLKPVTRLLEVISVIASLLEIYFLKNKFGIVTIFLILVFFISMIEVLFYILTSSKNYYFYFELFTDLENNFKICCKCDGEKNKDEAEVDINNIEIQESATNTTDKLN